MLISLAVSNYDCYVFLDTGLLWPLCWMLGIGCEHIVLDRCGWYLLSIAITDTSYCCYYLPPLLPFVLVLHHTKTSLNGSASWWVWLWEKRALERKVHELDILAGHARDLWFSQALPETIQQPVGTIGKYALSVNALAHRLQHLMLACGLFLLSPPELVELPTAWKPNLPRCKRRKANSLLHPPVSQQHSQAYATTSSRSSVLSTHSWQSLKCLLNSGFLNIVASIAWHKCLTVVYPRDYGHCGVFWQLTASILFFTVLFLALGSN